jgi:hypothetical protein
MCLRVKTARQDRNMCFTAFRVYHSTVQTILSRLQQLDITTKRPIGFVQYHDKHGMQ